MSEKGMVGEYSTDLCPVETESDVPTLCVDLDGTLVRTDILWECLLLLFSQQPWILLLCPFWLLGGKAYFKRQISERIQLDAANLPYREDVLRFLYEEKERGREILLATGSDQKAVESIVQHLGVFSDVIASDGNVNLSGITKCKVLEARFGYRQFDYMGNSSADLSVWQSANAAILIEPSTRLINKAKRLCPVQEVFTHQRNRLVTLLRALRVHHWVKNVLIFVPLIMAHKVNDPLLSWQAICAFLAFSFCASSVYILNDLLDLQADRQHPNKKNRPFAAGSMSISKGIITIPIMLICSVLLAIVFLPPLFTVTLVSYFIITTLYSLYLKKIPVADIMLLAGLYTFRIIAGGVAVDVRISAWLLGFSLFFFLSLALMKRCAELRLLQLAGPGEVFGRGYIRDDQELLKSMGSASGYLSVLILALYINSQEVVALYEHPNVLWLVCPILLYWITRMWFLAHRGVMEDDPIVITFKDPLSYALGIVVVVLLVAAL